MAIQRQLRRLEVTGVPEVRLSSENSRENGSVLSECARVAV